MEDISDIFEKLRISLAGEDFENPNVDERLPPVQSLIDETIESLKTTEENVLTSKICPLLPHIEDHLRRNISDITTASLLKLVAEVSKSENLRQECANAGIITCVLDCLEQDNPAIILQALRAIGNISCDNNKAREKILDSGGVEKIIKKLKELHDLDSKTNTNEKLQSTACGSVLNITLDNELLQKEVVNFGAIPVLLSYIEDNSDKADLCFMAANAISSLVELDEGRSSFISSRGCQIFVNILKTSSDRLTSAIGECLMGLSEEDDIRMALVKENCVEVLQEILSKNNSCDSEDKDLITKLKVAVDLIILLLGDDPCLELLFAEENNAFIDKILLWNNSYDAYIRNSSPVAIGNIARTETNCVRLVKMDIHKHLIHLLHKTTEDSEKDEVQLHVSVLSAMKNLAIPVNNKAVLIQSGALDCTLKCMNSPDTPSPLVYKAIGVTRLLVHGQATAVDTVCSQEQCIINIVSVAQTSGIDSLKFEASRLLATLLKNARTSDSILTIVKNNGLPPVVSMLNSSHTIMQNEALVAIALTVNVLDNDLSDKINESGLLSSINNIFEDDHAEPQTCYNSMGVIEALFIKGIVQKSKLEDSGILNNLERLANHEHATVNQRASDVIQKIKNP